MCVGSSLGFLIGARWCEAEFYTLRPLAELCSSLVPFLFFGNVTIQYDLFLGYQKLVKIDCHQLCLVCFNFLCFVFLYYTFSTSVSFVPSGTIGPGLRLGDYFVRKDPWGVEGRYRLSPERWHLHRCCWCSVELRGAGCHPPLSALHTPASSSGRLGQHPSPTVLPRHSDPLWTAHGVVLDSACAAAGDC